jgi:hypothetical protein
MEAPGPTGCVLVQSVQNVLVTLPLSPVAHLTTLLVSCYLESWASGEADPAGLCSIMDSPERKAEWWKRQRL